MSIKKNTYEIHSISDPLFPVIFHLDQLRGERGDFGNWHENPELIAVVSGRGRVRIDSRSVEAEAGDVIAINCNSIHSFVTDSEMDYYCLIVDRKFCLENGIDVLSLQLEERIKDPFLHGEILKLASLEAEYKKGQRGHCIHLALRHALLGILLSAYRDHLCADAPEREVSTATGMVKEVIRYLCENLLSEIRLDDVAAHVNSSKYHVARQFRAVVGSTIFDYLNMLRCREARRFLSMGYTVSEAASASGYSNLSYFTKCFKRYEGVLPSAYARGKR